MTIDLSVDTAHEHVFDVDDSVDWMGVHGDVVLVTRSNAALDYLLATFDPTTADVLDEVTLAGSSGAFALVDGGEGHWLFYLSSDVTGSQARAVEVDGTTGAITLGADVAAWSFSDHYFPEVPHQGWRIDATTWALVGTDSTQTELHLYALDLSTSTFTNLATLATGYATGDGYYAQLMGLAVRCGATSGLVAWLTPPSGVDATSDLIATVYDDTGSVLAGPTTLATYDGPGFNFKQHSTATSDGTTAVLAVGDMRDGADHVSGPLVTATESAIAVASGDAVTPLAYFGLVAWDGTVTPGVGQDGGTHPRLRPMDAGTVQASAQTILDHSPWTTDAHILVIDTSTGDITEDAASTSADWSRFVRTASGYWFARFPSPSQFVAPLLPPPPWEGTGEVVIEASGDLAVGPPLLDGSGQVGVEAFGLLTVGDEGLRAWDADESQKAAVVIEARGVLTVHPGVVTPPAGVVLADLRRVSPTMPTPTLDANGRPT